MMDQTLVKWRKLLRWLLRWRWDGKLQEWNLRRPFGRSYATVWTNGVWHTWSKNGTGGWNDAVTDSYCSTEDLVEVAKRQAWIACAKQKFI